MKIRGFGVTLFVVAFAIAAQLASRSTATPTPTGSAVGSQPTPLRSPPPEIKHAEIDHTITWQLSSQTPPSLENAPAPESSIAPGFQGLFSELSTPMRRNAAGKLIVVPMPPLEKYVPYSSLDTPADPTHFNIRQIVVKFVEGSGVRLRHGKLIISSDADAVETRNRLSRSRLEPSELEGQLRTLRQLITGQGIAIGRAAPQVDEANLALLRQRAERNVHVEMPDLNLFFFVHSRAATPEAATTFLQALRNLRIVETAYFQPIPFDAVDIPPTTTIDVTPQQGYFMSAPMGIDVNFARHVAGGRGEDVRVVDIEAGWDGLHEDLPAVSFGYGVNWGVFSNSDHGTAVLGEIAAQENGFGANGIAPNAAIGWSSVTNVDLLMPWKTYFYSVGNALLSALYFLRPSDIALIEQHFPNPAAGPCPNTCNCGQFGFVAVETVPYEHAAISILTGVGVIVVEAAGNGQVMVTPASTRDSGAIVVGASNDNLGPACFTNFGPRVNVHAWGGGIGSLGFGGGGVDPTLRANGADARQWYTRSFSGTSGASPIVVGAAALIQSTRAARGLQKLSPTDMRTLLVTTGTPQTSGLPATPIGPLPNLSAAIATYIPDSAQFVSQTAGPASISPGANFGVTVTFKNTGGLLWTNYAMSIAPSDSGAMNWTSPSHSVGTSAAPINPGEQASAFFNIAAPTQPGNYQLQFVLRNSAGRDMAFSTRQAIAVASADTPVDNGVVTILTQFTGSLPVGVPLPVIAKAQNTGETTWSPAQYLLKLTRNGRLALPQPTAAVSHSVGPGQIEIFNFVIQCNSDGSGGFSAQLSGPSGTFGAAAGSNVDCKQQ